MARPCSEPWAAGPGRCGARGRCWPSCTDGCTRIPAPDWLADAPCGRGDRLIHLDLHPLNVMITGKGPVVIDWPNAARGDGNTDVALTWVLLAAGGIPAGRLKATVMGWGRTLLNDGLLANFDRAADSSAAP